LAAGGFLPTHHLPPSTTTRLPPTVHRARRR